MKPSVKDAELHLLAPVNLDLEQLIDESFKNSPAGLAITNRKRIPITTAEYEQLINQYPDQESLINSKLEQVKKLEAIGINELKKYPYLEVYDFEKALKPKSKGLILSKCYYIVKAITYQVYTKEEYSRNSYVPLNSTILSNVLSNEYKKYIDLLKQLDVLEVYTNENGTECFTINEKSKLYRLTKKYRNAEHKHFVISDKGGKIKKKIQSHHFEEFKSLTDSQPHLKKLLDNVYEFAYRFSGSGVTIAQEYIRHLYDVKYPLKDKVVKTKSFYYIKKNRFFNAENLAYYNYVVGCLSQLEIYVNQDRVNRIHSNFTEFPNLLTPIIKDSSGRSLVELDVTASHFCLLYSLMREKSAEFFENNVITDQVKYLEELEEFQNVLSLAPGKPENLDIFNLLVAICKDIDPEKAKDWERKDAKAEAYPELLYARKLKNTLVTKAFNQLFPQLYLVLNYLRKDGHKEFSHLILKKESNILDKVIRRITEECPQAEYLTKHDAILIDPDNKDKVKQIFVEVLKEHTGLDHPWVKEKDLELLFKNINEIVETRKDYNKKGTIKDFKQHPLQESDSQQLQNQIAEKDYCDMDELYKSTPTEVALPEKSKEPDCYIPEEVSMDWDDE